MRMRSTFLLAGGLLAALASAWGQYKVVAPDGRVTYTDRPPADASAKVTELGRRIAPAEPAPSATLPLDLRQLVERFPVTLFTAADCAPCDRGRELLRTAPLGAIAPGVAITATVLGFSVLGDALRDATDTRRQR